MDRELEKSHWQDDIWHQLQTIDVVRHRKCESHQRRSETHHWQAWRPIAYPPSSIWYCNIESDTIKLQPTRALFMTFWYFDLSDWYKMKNCLGWRIAMNTRVQFKLQITASLGLHAHLDWCYQTVWLFAGAPEDLVDNMAMEKHSAKELNCVLTCLIHAIQTKHNEAQNNVAHWMIHIAKPWAIRRWSEFNLVNGILYVQIPQENQHLVDLEWTQNQQAELKTFPHWYTVQGSSECWRVLRWQLACSHYIWETPRIAMTCHDKGIMNCHLTVGWNL